VADPATGAAVCPTSMINPVNAGMCWNRTMWREFAEVIAWETRALWLAGATEESEWSGRPHIGLDVWSPVINLARDPRWGRNQEVPGEDPLLLGDFGAAYTAGVQTPTGGDPRYLATIVTLKHAFAYSLENVSALGLTRHNFNAVVSNYTLATTYLPAFKQGVDAGAAGIMCSYNAVNGVPSCADEFLLQDTLRNTWGFSGYITSDTGALADIWQQHKYVSTEAEAACAAIRDGTTDVSSDVVYHNALLQAVSDGLCSDSDVRAALNRTLTVRFQLGLFDPAESQPYWAVPLSAVATPASAAFNLAATLASMTLLHNDGGVLPLPAGSKVAVIGPHANASAALVGNYLGQLCPDDTLNCVPTVAAGIAAANGAGAGAVSVVVTPMTANDTSSFAAAVAAAQAADVVVLALGIDNSIESESLDRLSIDLPAIQHAIAAAVAAVGKPTAVVLIHGGMVDVTAEKANPAIGAILEAGYPGMMGATAIGMTLYGQNDHLGGKLPYTVYPADYVNQINMTEYEMDVGPGRTYRFYTGPTVYPFGWGVSLTTFAVAPVAAPAPGAAVLPTEAAPSRVLSYSVNVTNTGARPGDEVVFLYMSPQKATLTSPSVAGTALIKQLLDYQRVHLAPGESTTVSFDVSSASLALVAKPTGHTVSTPGVFNIVITNGVDQTVTHEVAVAGDEVIVAKFPGSA
jgi:xylan 1,4-beta-xylosidase